MISLRIYRCNGWYIVEKPHGGVNKYLYYSLREVKRIHKRNCSLEHKRVHWIETWKEKDNGKKD